MELLELLQEERGTRGTKRREGGGLEEREEESGAGVLRHQTGGKSGLGRGRRGRPEGREKSKEEAEEEEGSNDGGVQQKKMVEEGGDRSGEEDETTGKRRSKSATCSIM